MQRLRRSRVVTAPTRVQRTPRPSVAEARSVSYALTVVASITEGNVSEEEFAEWLTDAISRYHLWRSGWVGLGMTGRIKTPEVMRDGS